jgi:WD40 repeat protein
LLREWPRLRGWLEEDREGRRVHRALAIAAQDWVSADRNDDLLFRGSRLAAALDVDDAHPAEINPVERDFLGASRAHQDVELRTAQRTTRRLRRLTIGLSLVLVVALIAGAFSIVQRSRANDSADRAEEQATLAQAQRLAALSRVVTQRDYQQRLRLAVEAYRLDPGPESEGALESALVAVPGDRSKTITFPQTGSLFGGITPDGKRMVVAGGDALTVISATTGKTIDRIPLSLEDEAASVDVSGDGTWAAVGKASGGTIVVDLASRRVVAGELASKGALGTRFDPSDRRRLFVVGSDGKVVLWDLTRPEAPTPRVLASVHSALDTSVPLLLDVTNDGSRLVVGDTTINEAFTLSPSVVVDTRTGEAIASVPGAFGAISNDGRYVASVDASTGSARVTDLATGTVTIVATPSIPRVSPIMSFDPTGARLAVTDFEDNQAHAVDWRTGKDLIDPIDLFGVFTFSRFLPDGRLYTRNGQRALITDIDLLQTPAPVGIAGARQLPWDEQWQWGIYFGADGKLQALTDDGSVHRWNPSDLSQSSTDRPGTTVEGDHGVLLSPDRRRVAVLTSHEGGATQDVVERRTGKVIATQDLSFAGGLFGLWSPASSALALFAEDGQVFVMDARSGRVKTLFGASGVSFGRMAFSPDGSRLAVVHAEDEASAARAMVFDVASGRRLATFVGPKGTTIWDVAWSADGKKAALVAVDPRAAWGSSTVQLMDPRTGDTIDSSAALESIGLQRIAFTHGGRRLVAWGFGGHTGARVGTVRFFDSDGLLQVGDPITLGEGVFGLWVSGDGSHALQILGSPDGPPRAAIVWDVTPKAWVRTACDLAGRPFSRVEWRKVMLDRPYDPACA